MDIPIAHSEGLSKAWHVEGSANDIRQLFLTEDDPSGIAFLAMYQASYWLARYLYFNGLGGLDHMYYIMIPAAFHWQLVVLSDCLYASVCRQQSGGGYAHLE